MQACVEAQDDLSTMARQRLKSPIGSYDARGCLVSRSRGGIIDSKQKRWVSVQEPEHLTIVVGYSLEVSHS